MKFPARLHRSAVAAFSLIEIVLAVGIISFALVGILGLFPVALGAAADSREETQATFIADQVFAGLSSPIPFLPDASGSKHGASADLLTNRETTLYFGQEGELLTSASQALYEAEIKWTANNPSAGLTRVDLRIATPPGQTESKYNFVSLVLQYPSTTLTAP